MPKRTIRKRTVRRGGATSAKAKTAIKKLIKKITGRSLYLPGTPLPYVSL